MLISAILMVHDSIVCDACYWGIFIIAFSLYEAAYQVTLAFAWQPFADVEVGMPDDQIPAIICARMGIPEGSKWGHNAGEIRQMQQAAGMSFDNFTVQPVSAQRQPASSGNSPNTRPVQVDAQSEITSTSMIGTQI